MNTAAEQAIVDKTNAAIAAGEDPFGDNDPIEDQAAIDAQAAQEAAQAVTAAAATDPELNAEELEAIANGSDTPALPAVSDPLNFNIDAPTDYKTVRATLLNEESEAFAKMMDGEMDAKEYAAIKFRVMDSLEDLSAQRIRAETLQEVNTQSAAKSQLSAIQALMNRTKDEIPYGADAKAQKQFDIALNGLRADPDNATMSFPDLLNDAHKVVLALRGISPTQATGKTAAELEAIAQARKAGVSAPITLRGAPAASTANTGGDLADQLSRLKGQEYEAAFAKLTPSQQRAMLDS